MHRLYNNNRYVSFVRKLNYPNFFSNEVLILRYFLIAASSFVANGSASISSFMLTA